MVGQEIKGKGKCTMLLHKILNKLDDKGLAEKLAPIAGYGKAQDFRRALRENREIASFSGLVSIVQELFPKDEVKLLTEYAKEIHPNKKNARSMLEYLSFNRQLETFEYLLSEMEQCSNKESVEWAKVYRMKIEYDRCSSIEDYNKLIREILETNTSIDELNLFKNILLNYCYNQKHDYNMTKFLEDDIKERIELLENEYLKSTYEVRLLEIMSYNYLRLHNDPIQSRVCAERIVALNPPTAYEAYAYFIIGYSYLFTSMEKAISGLTKSIELYGSINRNNDVKDLKEKVEFVKIYWSKNNDQECVYRNNAIYYSIINGEDMTDYLSSENHEIDNPFMHFLKGLNDNSTKHLTLSMIKYVKRYDYFLANLAKIELLKRGMDEEILEEMTTF